MQKIFIFDHCGIVESALVRSADKLKFSILTTTRSVPDIIYQHALLKSRGCHIVVSKD